MGFDGGQRVTKPEAIGQIDIIAFDAEFVFEKSLAVKNLSYKRFGRRNIDITGCPGGAIGNPPALLYVALSVS
jgi:hypothetical protein